MLDPRRTGGLQRASEPLSGPAGAPRAPDIRLVGLRAFQVAHERTGAPLDLGPVRTVGAGAVPPDRHLPGTVKQDHLAAADDPLDEGVSERRGPRELVWVPKTRTC